MTSSGAPEYRRDNESLWDGVVPEDPLQRAEKALAQATAFLEREHHLSNVLAQALLRMADHAEVATWLHEIDEWEEVIAALAEFRDARGM